MRWRQEGIPSDVVAGLKELLSDKESEGAFCQTGQCGLITEAAAIMSPAEGEMRVTGTPPSRAQYVLHTFD